MIKWINNGWIGICSRFFRMQQMIFVVVICFCWRYNCLKQFVQCKLTLFMHINVYGCAAVNILSGVSFHSIEKCNKTLYITMSLWLRASERAHAHTLYIAIAYPNASKMQLIVIVYSLLHLYYFNKHYSLSNTAYRT